MFFLGRYGLRDLLFDIFICNITNSKVFYLLSPSFTIAWYGIFFHLYGVPASWEYYFIIIFSLYEHITLYFVFEIVNSFFKLILLMEFFCFFVINISIFIYYIMFKFFKINYNQLLCSASGTHQLFIGFQTLRTRITLLKAGFSLNSGIFTNDFHR